MFFIINKVCDAIPFKKEDIKIVRKLNDLSYEIKLNNNKTKRIDFSKPENYIDENKILIILDKELYEILDSIRVSKKLKYFICDLIVGFQDIDLKIKQIKQQIRRTKYKNILFKIKVFFMSLWYCGILSKKMNVSIKYNEVNLHKLLKYAYKIKNTQQLVKAYADPKLESKKSYTTRKKWFDFLESF